MSTPLLQNPDPIKTAIISYDLKNVKHDDNQKVKHALTQLTNTRTTPQDWKNPLLLSRLLNRELPDTTLLRRVEDPNISTKQIAEEVADVIRRQGAEVGKIYVAFISISDHYLINE
jgi:hypothetical protein